MGFPRITISSDTPQCGLKVTIFHSYCVNGEQICDVSAVGQECIPILEKSHWPAILLPFNSATPIETVKAAVEAHMVLRIDATGLDHGGEKHGFSNSAPV